MKHNQKDHKTFFILKRRYWEFKPLLANAKPTSMDSSSDKPKALIRNVASQPFELAGLYIFAQAEHFLVQEFFLLFFFFRKFLFFWNDMAFMEPAFNHTDCKLSQYEEVVRVYRGVEEILGYPLPTLQSHPINCYPAPYTNQLHYHLLHYHITLPLFYTTYTLPNHPTLHCFTLICIAILQCPALLYTLLSLHCSSVPNTAVFFCELYNGVIWGQSKEVSFLLK